ncbi:MAG: preprotein translocase subunit SecE [Actinobacteria bacterium]|nr:preprotein translocase subunit SecE [Actinomycetota bacterium]
MAQTANNDKGKPDKGKGKPTHKKAQGGKAVTKRAAAKPTSGKGQQKSRRQARAAKPGEKRGLMKFLRDVRIELGKVTWPTRKDLMQSTLVVLVAVAIATVYCFGLDTVFAKSVDVILSAIK